MTIRNGSAGSRKRRASASRRDLFRMCPLPLQGIGRGAGHDDLDRTGVVALPCPLRPQRHDLAVQLHANPAAHADHHGLAVHDFEPLLEMVDQVGGDEPQPLLRTDNGSQLRPLRLEAFLSFDLLTFGDFLEVGVDLRPFGLG